MRVGSRPNCIHNPAFLDHRSYNEVVQGRRRRNPPLEQPENGYSSSKEKENHDNHAQVSLNVSENQIMTDRLNLAAVIDINDDMDIKHAASLITDTEVLFACLSSLSLTKIIMLFDDELSLKITMEETSPLRKLFTGVRRWSGNECYRDRLTWIECVGLHPKCWSHESLTMIGEKWGNILKIDNEYSGINSITSARILIRTDKQQKIEESVRLVWQSGACNVWVYEVGRCECKYRSKKTQNGSFLKEPSKKIVLTEDKEPGIVAEDMRVHNNIDGMRAQNTEFEMQSREGDVQKVNEKVGMGLQIAEFETQRREGDVQKVSERVDMGLQIGDVEQHLLVGLDDNAGTPTQKQETYRKKTNEGVIPNHI
ncbi:unnamed protein product [Amaranthus hypochondriacus]